MVDAIRGPEESMERHHSDPLGNVQERRIRMRGTISCSIVVIALAAALYSLQPSARLAAQGMATRGVSAAPRRATSGKPFPVNFVDVAGDAALRMRFTSGGEASKKYIIEANGSGVAFIDYNNDGREDIFLVNASRLQRSAE